ncbi:MAG: hypothetical protein EPO35_03850 [Acidobacteria bacterium]|nr:MAG: hypothetical protein EPO35_03850 [Acidobacteriota bacterium]
MDSLRHRPGRPSKYGRPSRAVTVTLPEDVITQLQSLDNGDLGLGIVTLVERLGTPSRADAPIAGVSRYGKHSVIVVPPLNALKKLPGVELVPVGGGKALISLTKPHSIAQLELALRDAAEQTRVGSADRSALEAVADILRKARVSRGVSLQERTIMVLEPKRQRRRA